MGNFRLCRPDFSNRAVAHSILYFPGGRTAHQPKRLKRPHDDVITSSIRLRRGRRPRRPRRRLR
ncbi:predicted protein [Streptomyces viridosporus ATCC 14672]|uniref:Predicted protein n=1 Tax=Streptomyces viridosporus (strain ATCC 14672 / DSM 40746 / JCM 4963 / KCTC 9882 / NRRL B-12104 / FH 1290) TaxID=566461 RepID=D6A5D3_STRV1|nr:predicted protein [Streptomyces viridosporus ATCC 14672]